jgi:autotransporter-associated beta strand protein
MRRGIEIFAKITRIYFSNRMNYALPFSLNLKFISFLGFILCYNIVCLAQNSNITISNNATSGGSWNTLTAGTYTFVPSANNATVNVADIYSYLYNNTSHVTINTACANCTQAGQVDINYAVTGDVSVNYPRTFTINANGDINVNQSISLACSTNSFINESSHSISLNSTTGGINILALVTTQRITGNVNSTLAANGKTSGSITLSAPLGTIYSSAAGVLRSDGMKNGTNSNYDTRAGAISITAKGVRLLGAVSAVTRSTPTSYSGIITVSTSEVSVTSGGGVNDGISGLISGRNFTKNGVGSLNISSSTANDWVGTTIISEGILQLGIATSIPNNSAVTLSSSGAVLDVNGYSETIGSLASASGQGVVRNTSSISAVLSTGNNGTNTVYTGLIEDGVGVLGLTKLGVGKFTLSTTGNTYSGITTVSNGILEIKHSASLGSVVGGTSVSNGATLYVNNSISVGNESLTLNGAGDAGSLRSTSGTNVWGGLITLSTASTIYVDGGSSLTLTPLSGVAISSSNLGLTMNGGGSSTISGSVNLGTGGLVISNGLVTLMTSNSSSGSTTVNSGILNIRNNESLGTGSVSVLDGATLQLQGGISVANQLTLYGTGNGVGSLRSMSGDNIYNGNITLSTNTVRINTDANSLTISGNIAGGVIPLYMGGSGNTVLNGILSGSGGNLTWGTSPMEVTANTSIVKDGDGTVTLVGVNTYSGCTVLNVGMLQLGANNAISNSSSVIFDGGSLSTMGYSDNVGTLSLLDEGSTLTLGNGAHTLSFSGLGTMDYKTLTVTGWLGTSGATGSAGVLKLGSSASLLRSYLDQIRFNYNSGTYNTVQLSNGELVPGNTGLTGFANVRITNGTTTNGSWNTLTAGTYTFVPSANNATVNVADIYAYLYSNTSHVTINTVLASGTQAGQVDINYAVTGDVSVNYPRTFTINANGDINVNQSISLACSTNSFINESSHSISLNSTTGGINILALVTTQRITGNVNSTLAANGKTSGSITLSAPLGTIYSSAAGVLRSDGMKNGTNSNYDTRAGAISITAKGVRLLGAVSAVTRSTPTSYSGNITVSTSEVSVTSGGGVNDGISGLISGKNFTKSGVGSLNISSTTANDWVGTTTISEGTLQLGTATTIPSASAIYLNGGDLNDAGLNATFASLNLSNNSSITTGSTTHTLTFNTPGTFATGKILTIKGWTGSGETTALSKNGAVAMNSNDFITATGALQNVVLGGLNKYGKVLYGLSGTVTNTSSQIFIKGTALTSAQLSQIQFLNSATNGYYTTVQKASPSFEIVPGVSK